MKPTQQRRLPRGPEMDSLRLRMGLLALSLILLCAGTTAQANLVPDGGEMLLNLTMDDLQSDPEVAYSQNGAFRAAVWVSNEQDGDAAGVFARFGGSPVEVQVNQTFSGYQAAPDLSIADNGRVVIVWEGDDPIDDSIFARIFDATGTPLTGEFLVENLAGQQQLPRVDHFPGGNFVVAWDGQATDQTLLRVFDPIGSPVSPVQIASGLANQSGVDVSVGPNSFGIVTWRVNLVSPGAYYRIFNPNGTWTSPPRVASQTIGDYFYGTAASSAPARSFISWIRVNSGGTHTILTRSIDAGGLPITPETEVTEPTAPFVGGLAMSHDFAGRGVVVWDETDGTEGDVFMHCLSNTNPVGAAELVNTTMPERQRAPSVCHDNVGGLSIAWYTQQSPDDCFYQDYILGGASSVEPVEPRTSRDGLTTAGAPTVFRSTTNLSYRLESASTVETGIIDVKGRQVRGLARGPHSEGLHRVPWDGRDDSGRALPAGSYWFRARTPGSVSATRLILVR